MKKKLLLGNAAAAEGALESQVEVVAGYPGTPSSELIQYLSERVREEGLPTYVEWSVNEKVAIDVGTAAAWGGKRTMITMKMAGLNLASDTLVNIAYKGVKGGFVIYVADDPGTHAGCTEEDSRYYSFLTHVPVLDAADPADLKEKIHFAFKASEELHIPIIVRTTTNVAHTMGVVELGTLTAGEREFSFTKDLSVYTTILAKREQQHRALLDAMYAFGKLLDSEGGNPLTIRGPLAVAASGVSWTYLQEAMAFADVELTTLRIDCENPFPKQKAEQMISHAQKILVLEEQEPIVENQIKQVMAECGIVKPILGKEDDTLPRVGEYTYELVASALEKLTGSSFTAAEREENESQIPEVENRNLTFCVGCQHRSTYFTIAKAVRKAGYSSNDVIITGDIGCTSLGVFKPLETIWTEVTMGASIGLAHGFKVAGNPKPVIATLGDSTFFHAGLPPLINAVQHGVDMTVVIFDNRWTAMTGFQPNPNTGLNALQEPAKKINIRKVVEGLGISCEIIKPDSITESVEIVAAAIKKPGVNVIIAEEECALQRLRSEGKKKPYYVDAQTCRNCHVCINTFACPAISAGDEHAVISRGVCIGCGACAHVCPFGAILAVRDEEEAGI